MVSLRIVTLNAQIYFVMSTVFVKQFSMFHLDTGIANAWFFQCMVNKPYILEEIYRRFIESLVNLYQTARRDISEDSILYSQDHKNRKSHCPLILHFMSERIIKIIFSIKWITAVIFRRVRDITKSDH